MRISLDGRREDEQEPEGDSSTGTIRQGKHVRIFVDGAVVREDQQRALPIVRHCTRGLLQ